MSAAHLAQNPFSTNRQNRILLTFWSMLLALCITFSTDAFAENPISNPLLGAPVTQIAAAYGDERIYDISRKGKQIGTHTIRFQQQNKELLVNIESSITVRVLRIPVFSLEYVSSEAWLDNQLISASATTTENGESNKVALKPGNTEQPEFTTNHWHPGVLQSETVFNTLTGKANGVTLTNQGVEQVSTQAGTVSASRYQYTNDIEANVWYDDKGLWLKLSFRGDDGSVITYLRRD